MTRIKKYPITIILLCTLLAFSTSFPSLTRADITNEEQVFDALAPKLPALTVQSKQDPTYISPYMSYAFNLPVKDAQSVYAQKNSFKPYDNLQLEQELGTYWFLVSFAPVEDTNVSAAYLDIGNFLTKDSRILILPRNSNKWQLLDDVYTRAKLSGASSSDSDISDMDTESEITMFSSGLYDLTGLRDGGQLLIYSPGMPSIWFSPTLTLPAKASVTIDRRAAPFILVSLVLLMIFSLWRGLREEGDARLWAALLTLFALIQYIWGVPQNADGTLQVWDMIGIISAACALFLLPHLGRHYMVTEKSSPTLDGLLQFIALPAIFPIAIILVPLPEYLPIIRFAPLWGMYAFLPLVCCLPLALRGRKGSLFYVFFCFCIGMGSLAALAFRFNPEWYLAPQVGLVLAMTAMFLAPRQTEKNIHEKTYTHDSDHLSDFAENNIPMREAFFRVEAKLRDPFDRIMREACFLDFDTKAEDFTESINILAEKELGQRYDKHALNAIDDVAKRADRLRSHTDSLVRACRDLSGMMGLMPQLAKKVTPHHPTHELFNLKNLVLHACDGIRAEAQDKQIGLGWYIAPQMGLFYRGDKAGLEIVLELLLRDAVRATDKGMISIRVRRANNPNPGHIVFTISDSGKGKPPVQRSPLTLIKAWELSTNYNGQVELHSSQNGLSFSFSMECVAMDAQGVKPLSFASLDDIVLLSNEFDKSRARLANNTHVYSSDMGQSGGNIVFSRERKQDTMQENRTHANSYEYTDGKNHAGMAEPDQSHIRESNKISILLISPLAIQRQNIAWYLSKYELWEALDVDSALAFYEKKPARLVLIHSALSPNGCNAVLAGIRLLEDSLEISPAPFVGLYQSAKDMEFLRLAGCKHLLPANIGREDLCTAVAEIMDDPFIAPISNIDAEHVVIKNATQDDKRQTDQEIATEKAAVQAVAKRLSMRRVHVGQVIDGALESTRSNNNPYGAPSSYNPHAAYESTETKREQRSYPKQREIIREVIDDTMGDAMDGAYGNAQNSYNDADFAKPQTNVQRARQNGTAQDIFGKANHAQGTPKPVTEQKHASAHNHINPPHANALVEKTGFLSKLLQVVRPKPYKSLQDEVNLHTTDIVGEPTPLRKPIENQIYADSHAYDESQTESYEDTYAGVGNATNREIEAEIQPEAEYSEVTSIGKATFDDASLDGTNFAKTDLEKTDFHESDTLARDTSHGTDGDAHSDIHSEADNPIVTAHSVDDDEEFPYKKTDSDAPEYVSRGNAENAPQAADVSQDNDSQDTAPLADASPIYLNTENSDSGDATHYTENGANTHITTEQVDDASENIIDSDNQDLHLELKENSDIIPDKKITPRLAFLPSEIEDSSPASDEDIPTISSLPNAFNWNENNSAYPNMESEDIFIQGLADAKKPDVSDVAIDDASDLDILIDTAETATEVKLDEQHAALNPIDGVDGIDGTNNVGESTNNETLANLSFKLPEVEENKIQKRIRKKAAISQEYTSPIDMTLELNISKSPMAEKNNAVKEQGVKIDKPVQLSFFPSPKDSDK